MTERSVGKSLAAVLETLRISAPTMVEGAVGRARREDCDRRLASWSKRLVEHAGISLTVTGLETVPADETFVVMSNHQSNYDIPVLFAAFPRTLRMVAKTELFRIPVFGPALTAAEFIEIDRGHRERALASLRVAREKLRSGINVWIAPEGTRSHTGRLGTFKKGGFLLALETGTRILPVALEGTRDVLPADAAILRRGRAVSVRFLPPIDAPAYGVERRDELVAAVRSAIEGALPAALRSR